jgi:hypothetical protein
LLVDKVVGRLSAWKGRLLNKAGRLALVNYVLTSTMLYHMPVFQLSKWVIKNINRIRPLSHQLEPHAAPKRLGRVRNPTPRMVQHGIAPTMAMTKMEMPYKTMVIDGTAAIAYRDGVVQSLHKYNRR